VVAAGNDYHAGIQNSYSDNAYADAPDNGVVGSPSTFVGALSVASIDNAHVTSNYIKAGELNIPINLVSEHNILSELNGQTLEMVVIPGVGDSSDYKDLDVTGKIAMVMRGTLTFSDKVINASKAGAAACIIYNNRDNIVLNMQITDYAIPTCAIPSYTDALKLIATSNSISFFNRLYISSSNE
jgi:PA domain.